MKWFKHHTSAHRDAKLRKLTMRYGADGYAIYWYCLELIAGSISGDNLTFELEHDSSIIAADLRVDSARVEEIMSFMVNLGLFECHDDRITCLKIAKHLDERFARTTVMKDVIKSARQRELTPTSLKTIARQSEDRLQTRDRQSAVEEKRREEKSREEIKSTSGTLVTALDGREEIPPGNSPRLNDTVPYDQILDAYHSALPDLPRVALLTPARRKRILAHHRGIMEHDLGNWIGYFKAVATSDFLMGRRKDWRADLDFLLRPQTPVKVLEGSYR